MTARDTDLDLWIERTSTFEEWYRTQYPGLPQDDAPEVIEKLISEPVSIVELSEAAHRAHEVASLFDEMAKYGAIELACGQPATCKFKPLGRAAPIPRTFPAGKLEFSRFAYLRRFNDRWAAESATGLWRMSWCDPEVLCAILSTKTPIEVPELVATLSSSCGSTAQTVAAMLVAAGIFKEIQQEDEDPEATGSLATWEFHDLLFHSKSRLGRTDEPVGATFRFRGKRPPAPAIKRVDLEAPAIQLTRPSLKFETPQRSLHELLEARRSTRSFGPSLISYEQISTFLFLSSRIKSHYFTTSGEFTSRPYPSGGASYEIEIYLVCNTCLGIPRAVYYYDAYRHSLVFRRDFDAQADELIADAWVSSAGLCVPQVLLLFGCRFDRVSWKYQSMAYATSLKNVGVLFGTMYLVAESLGLGCCALGVGNASLFSKVVETDFFAESSIGEMALGAK